MKNYAEVIAKGSFFVFLMYAIGAASGYILRIYLAKNLSLEDFGLFYALLAFSGIFILFRDLGLSSAMVKYIAESDAKNLHKDSKTYFLTGLGIQLIIGTIIMAPIILFSNQIAVAYFKTPAASFPLIIVAITYIISIFFSIQYLFQGLGKIKHYSLIEPMRNVLTLFFALILISLGVLGVALSYLFAAIFGLAITYLALIKIFPLFTLKAQMSFDKTKKLLIFSLPVFLAAAAGTVLGYTDTILITYFRSLTEVGLYNAAMPTSQLLWIVASSITIVLLPVSAELWTKKERQLLSKIVQTSLKLCFVAIIPLVIVFVSFPEIFLRLFFGEAYVAASAAMQILAINAAFFTLFAISSTVLLGIGKTKINVIVYSFVALLNLAGNILLVPSFGIAGAAFSTTISYLAGSVLSLYYLEKNLLVRMPLDSILKAVFCGLGTLLIVFALKQVLNIEPWIELLFSAIIGSLFYVFFIFFFRAVGKEDVKMLERIKVRIPNGLSYILNKLAK